MEQPAQKKIVEEPEKKGSISKEEFDSTQRTWQTERRNTVYEKEQAEKAKVSQEQTFEKQA